MVSQEGEGGDSGPAVVVDLGSNNLRLGLAGEDKPRIRMPSYFGLVKQSSEASKDVDIRVGEDGLRNFDEDMQLQSIVEYEGASGAKIRNWDALETMIKYGMGLINDGKPNKDKEKIMSNVILAENILDHVSQREKYAQLFFEKFDAPGIFFSKAPVLSCYAYGRSTGVVMDIGASHSRAVAVQDGYMLKDTIKVSQIAGNRLASETLKAFEENKAKPVKIVPRYGFSKKIMSDGSEKITHLENLKVHGSYKRYFQHEICQDIFQSLCKVKAMQAQTLQAKFPSKTAGEKKEEKKEEEKPEIESYTLPDGTVVTDEKIRYSIPEHLFSPNEVNPPIQELVLNATNAVSNAELRRELLQNVVLCGGCSAFEGLYERFLGELDARTKVSAKARVIVAGFEERTNCTWIGGSIVASLSEFSPMFITKSQYAETGPKIFDKKCP